jgi:SWI/SNF-related matrix-associated actin-dependent regulator of chromatin subfamily D
MNTAAAGSNPQSSLPPQRKRKRPHERNIPSALSHLPESQLYAKLQYQEKKLDALLIRKRLDIQEALTRPLKVY